MTDSSVKPSPWWYRNRGSVIGMIYGAGFFVANIRFTTTTPPAPTAMVLGAHVGDAGAQVLLWLGVALVVLAWLTRFAGTAYLRGEVVFAPNVQRDRLIISGIFRYVRNPLYLGNDLLALGAAMYAPPLGAAIEPSFRAAFFSESFALVIAIALVPVAVAGQAGRIPGAIIFVVAIPLFFAASRMGRR